MGHEWWIFATGCAVIACSLIWMHRRRRRRLALVNRFEHYVTPELVEKVLSEPLPEGEFCDITMLITNLTGYVPFCETAGNDEAVAAINAHRSLLVPIMRQHRGVITEFFGDATTCLFGAPRHDSDHAGSAVAAALELLQAHESFIDQLRARGLPKLRLRIGIATGRAVIGHVGPPSAYGALGDEVNRSMELQSECKVVGTSLLISPRTAERIAGRFQLRRIALPQGSLAGEFAFEIIAPLAQNQHLSKT